MNSEIRMAGKRCLSQMTNLANPQRSFVTSAYRLAARAPSISDIKPHQGPKFDARQQEWRQRQVDAVHEREKAASRLSFPIF